jgi:hypothetical protein
MLPILRKTRLATIVIVAACSSATTAPNPKSEATFTVSDAAVQALASVRSGWVFYKNRPDTLNRSQGSGHPEARLLTRYNAKAATQLDATGKVRAGAVFPDSSIIVKDLINGNSLVTVAVMMKLSKSPQATPDGWIWTEYSANGNVAASVNSRGQSCTGCHGSGIDFTRMNDSQP